MKTLIVDDSAIIRRILRGLLKQLGHTDVLEAGDGKEAMQKLGETSCDLMLLDIHMPTMAGDAVLAALRDSMEFRDLPVIIISADSGRDQVEAAMQLGARGYIGKPFKLGALREAIDKVYATGASKAAGRLENGKMEERIAEQAAQ